MDLRTASGFMSNVGWTCCNRTNIGRSPRCCVLVCRGSGCPTFTPRYLLKDALTAARLGAYHVGQLEGLSLTHCDTLVGLCLPPSGYRRHFRASARRRHHKCPLGRQGPLSCLRGSHGRQTGRRADCSTQRRWWRSTLHPLAREVWGNTRQSTPHMLIKSMISAIKAQLQGK